MKMIEDKTTWYLGTIGNRTSYKLAKYSDENVSGYAASIDSKVGLLRYGELMAGQIDITNNNSDYWTITPAGQSNAWYAEPAGAMNATYGTSVTRGIRPCFNLKSNVMITSGDGTLQNPFQIELG